MKIPILVYHRIGRAPGDRQYKLPPRLFGAQMRFLATRGYRVISLALLIEALDGRETLPPNPVVITFDDGFEETYRYAVPALKRFGFPATFFVVTRLMGRTSAWMERADDGRAPLMGWSEVETLVADGFTLGSHTATHRSLTTLDDQTACEEIAGSKRDLEDRLGTPIRFFAYPYGHLTERTRALVCEAGYGAACSTRSGFNASDTDRYVLHRLDVSTPMSLARFRRRLRVGKELSTFGGLVRYYLRRAVGRLGWTG